ESSAVGARRTSSTANLRRPRPTLFIHVPRCRGLMANATRLRTKFQMLLQIESSGFALGLAILFVLLSLALPFWSISRTSGGVQDDRCRNLHDRWFLGDGPTVAGCDLVLGPGSRMVAPPRRRGHRCQRRGPAVSEEPSVHGTECERDAAVHVVC